MISSGHDVFVFGAGDGHDVIGDFTPSSGNLKEHDTIRFVGTRLKSFQDITESAVQIQGGVVIEIDDVASVTLVGIRLAALKASHFEFV